MVSFHPGEVVIESIPILSQYLCVLESKLDRFKLRIQLMTH